MNTRSPESHVSTFSNAEILTDSGTRTVESLARALGGTGLKISTYENLLRYTSKRYADNQAIADFCNLVDALSCRDLLSITIAACTARAEDLNLGETLKGSHFHESTSIDQRIYHELDGIVYDVFVNIPFIELSPVQPFGLNAVLAGLSEDNIVATVRRSEVNADISTSLFREAIMRRPNVSEVPLRLASNARITRAQSFDPKTKFLPHFRMFGQVTTGREVSGEHREMGGLITHLKSEIDLLDQLKGRPEGNLERYVVEIGNVDIVQELANRGLIDLEDLRRRTAQPDFSMLTQYGLPYPDKVALSSPELSAVFDQLGLTAIAADVETFKHVLQSESPEIYENAIFDFSRIAGMGYYKNMCYKVYAIGKDGIVLPLIDGGTTDWAAKSTTNKKAYSVSSGVGTELIARYFL